MCVTKFCEFRLIQYTTAMKSLISITIVFINVSVVLSVHFFQVNTLLKHKAKFASDQALQQHRLAKRQTTDEETPTPEQDMVICTAQLNNVSCSFGITQGFVDTSLRCGTFYESFKQAQRDANACAKSENGQFCGSAFDLNGINLDYIEQNCTRAPTLNRNESCSPDCRTLLEDFRNRLGCCINAYINGSRIWSYSASVDYRVWNMCNVPLPPEDCANGPTISPPSNVKNCTNEDLFNEYYVQNYCLPERAQPYIDVLRKCGSHIAVENYKSICSADANGVPCGRIYYQSFETDVSPDILNSVCKTSNINCTSSCRDIINTAKNHFGCCLSSVLSNETDSIALSYSVLKSCNIEPPGTCDHSLIDSAMSNIKESHSTLITACLMCHYLYLLIIA